MRKHAEVASDDHIARQIRRRAVEDDPAVVPTNCWSERVIISVAAAV